MKRSLSYYIMLIVLKIKGIKKDFSKDPIDFKKIRKQSKRIFTILGVLKLKEEFLILFNEFFIPDFPNDPTPLTEIEETDEATDPVSL